MPAIAPIAPVTLPGGNGDLPASQFPTLTRISVIDLVGPNAANRQHKSLEKRSVSLAQLVNLLIANNNVIDDIYLRRDMTTQNTNGAGVLNNIPMNGSRLVGMPASGATGQAVEHDQFNLAVAAKAPLNSPNLTGNPTAPTPAPGDNDASLATTAFVTAAIAAIPPPASFDLVRPIPSDLVSVDGSVVTLAPGGLFYLGNLSIAGIQTLTKPLALHCSGNFTLAPGGSITSPYPVTIECGGTVSIQGPITAPLVIIRCAGAVSISGAVNCHSTNYSALRTPTVSSYLGSLLSQPLDITRYDPYGSLRTGPQGAKWRALIVDAGGNFTLTAAVVANDLFVKSGGDVTITATHTLYPHFTQTSPPYNHYGDGTGWAYGDQANTIYGNRIGGGGGTGGGHGYGTTATRSLWRGSPAPYLIPAYALAWGGSGGAGGIYYTGRGGGRVSLYADGNMTLAGAVFELNGAYGAEVGGGGQDGGAGGGGTWRGVCRGTMTGGTVNAAGNGSPDGVGGGGGGVYAIAAAFGAALAGSLSAAGPNAEAGTTMAVVLSSARILHLRRQRLFDVLLPDSPNLQQ